LRGAFAEYAGAPRFCAFLTVAAEYAGQAARLRQKYCRMGTIWALLR
jgi:hypothetical protein